LVQSKNLDNVTSISLGELGLLPSSDRSVLLEDFLPDLRTLSAILASWVQV
jgi:hypothetical protein